MLTMVFATTVVQDRRTAFARSETEACRFVVVLTGREWYSKDNLEVIYRMQKKDKQHRIFVMSKPDGWTFMSKDDQKTLPHKDLANKVFDTFSNIVILSYRRKKPIEVHSAVGTGAGGTETYPLVYEHYALVKEILKLLARRSILDRMVGRRGVAGGAVVNPLLED